MSYINMWDLTSWWAHNDWLKHQCITYVFATATKSGKLIDYVIVKYTEMFRCSSAEYHTEERNDLYFSNVKMNCLGTVIFWSGSAKWFLLCVTSAKVSKLIVLLKGWIMLKPVLGGRRHMSWKRSIKTSVPHFQFSVLFECFSRYNCTLF
jgi:hypothetical protein